MRDVFMATVKNNLTSLSHEISEGISLFTACRNRSENLERALQTWLKHDEVDEIIVLDWSSDQSLKPLIDKYQNGKLVLAEAPGQGKWILSHAYNLAARLTTRTRIFKIDADVEITGDFFQRHALSAGRFFSGNWRKARDLNERHLNGMVYLLRDDFFRVNGYNEFIKSYGWDDCNFYERLESLGLVKKDIDLNTLHHIEHEKRVAQDPAHGSLSISDDTEALLNIHTNMAACGIFPDWHTKQMMRFDVRVIGNNHFSCVQPGEDENVADEGIMSQARATAMRTVLSYGSTYGPPVPQEMTAGLESDELFKLYKILNILPPQKEDQKGFVFVVPARSHSDVSGLLKALDFFHMHYHNAAVSEMHVFYIGHSSDILFRYLVGKDHIKIFMQNADPTLEELLQHASLHLADRKVIICNNDRDFSAAIDAMANLDFSFGMFSLIGWDVSKSIAAPPPAPGFLERAKGVLSILKRKLR